MSDHHRQLVRESIDALGDDINTLSQDFYRLLLARHPEMSSIFPGSVPALNKKFFNMLAMLKNVKHLEKIRASIYKVGERHGADYMVIAAHLPLAKSALIDALALHLGEGFDDELRQAWDSVYDEVSEIFAEALQNIDSSTATQSSSAALSHDEGLLEAVGGWDGILRVHTNFYEELFEHPWLRQFFRGKHPDILAKKQTEFMVAAFGGENLYKGDTPAFVHMHMFITEEQLQLRDEMLKRHIMAAGNSEELAERWLAVDHSFWPAIQKATPDECVLKCLGQYPIIAKKPEGF